MPLQGRLGDKSFAPADGHGCVLCPHLVVGPAVQGSPTVLVNNLPALRLDDRGVHAVCCGPNTWTAVKGSKTVFINRKAAHRLGDQDQHCGGTGVLIEGSPNVMVGDSGNVIRGLMANAERRPTAQEIQEIQDAINAGDHQRAIDLTVAYYGIDTANVPGGVQYDPTESNYGVTSFDGRIQLGPVAMSSPEVLASTIVHETTHANQSDYLRGTDSSLNDWPSDANSVNYDEAMAYESELQSASHTGLNQNASELGTAQSRRNNHYNGLSADDQQDFNNGDYPP